MLSKSSVWASAVELTGKAEGLNSSWCFFGVLVAAAAGGGGGAALLCFLLSSLCLSLFSWRFRDDPCLSVCVEQEEVSGGPTWKAILWKSFRWSLNFPPSIHCGQKRHFTLILSPTEVGPSNAMLGILVSQVSCQPCFGANWELKSTDSTSGQLFLAAWGARLPSAIPRTWSSLSGTLGICWFWMKWQERCCYMFLGFWKLDPLCQNFGQIYLAQVKTSACANAY